MQSTLGTCLVIGGGGFLGSALVRQLLPHAASVRVLGRHEYPELTALGVQCIKGDIRNPDDVLAATLGCDTVFNTAAVCDVVPNRQIYFDVNVTGCANVLEACKRNQVGCFVHTSSPSVVMGRKDIIDGDESLPYLKHYLAPYPQTKAIAEKMVLACTDGPRVCAIRPHLIWGARDPHILPVILQQADKGILRRVGDGTNMVSVTHVDNAAYAHLLAAKELAGEGKCSGKAYFVNDTVPVNLWKWIDNVLTLLGRPPVCRHIPRSLAYALAWCNDLASSLLSIKPTFTRFVADSLAKSHTFRYDAAARDFGYAPIVTPQQGMADIVKAYL